CMEARKGIHTHTKATIEETFRKTYNTLPYCSIPSRKASILVKFIISLLAPCSCWISCTTRQTSSRLANHNWNSSIAVRLAVNHERAWQKVASIIVPIGPETQERECSEKRLTMG